MKIEMDDNTLWLGTWAIVAAAISTIIIACTAIGVGYHRTALEKGYSEKQMMAGGTMWQKP